MGRLLATFATLLILLLAGASFAPAFMDWDAYRPDIQKAASALLGRKISIAGDIDVALLPEPHLHAQKVTAEGDPSEAAEMTAEAVDLTLSLQALLSGRVEASKLRLINPFVILDLSKPLQPRSELEKAGLAPPPPAAMVTDLEIEGGRISVYPDAGQAEALTLTGVDGAFAAAPDRKSYRFTGRVSQSNRRFDVKFTAAPQAGGVKLAGSATETRSKAAIQADGVLTTSDAPLFEGALTLRAPQMPDGALFGIEAKAGAKLNRQGLALSDLLLTLDAGGRPQILAGSANLAFTPAMADILLEVRSLDADALFPGGSGGEGAASNWEGVRNALDEALWLYPDFGVHLSLAADQVQLRGDVIEGIKAEGTRLPQKWLFEDARATFPGGIGIKLTGALKKTAAGPELLARAALEGKNLGRLNRWIAPGAASARSGAARAFTAGGLLTLSGSATAFTEVKGDVDGAPFKASLRLDKTPARKLKVSLACDSFDLTSLEAGQTGAGVLSGEGLKSAWRAALAQLTPLLGDDPASVDAADVDLSATSLKTSVIEAKNVAVQFKLDGDMLTVKKLTAEAADGASLHAEGAVPMRGGEQGRFDGRLDISSPQAVLKLAALAGYDSGGIAGRRAEGLAPAVLTIGYSTDGRAGGATAQIGGTLGGARLDGRVDLKGGLADWRSASVSGQLALSAADGGKLAALLSPKEQATPGASASPGLIAIRASGVPADRLDAAVTVKAPSLQAQIDGTAKFRDAFSFSGKGQASSPEPERFLPPALLALLGGEPQSGLTVESAFVFGSGRLDVPKLKAESAKNVVSGHLAIGGADRVTEIEADLKADQLSLPAILGYLLDPSSADRLQAASPASLAPASCCIWSDRPFVLKSFQESAAKISLAAKMLKLGDTLALSDAQVSASLDDGRLDIQKLTGKAFGGDVAASLSLDGRGSLIAASTKISLVKADLAALAAKGTPPLAAGKVSLSLQASGQGLSPRGLLSVLQGRGVIALADGQLAKFSPARVQKSGDELAALPQPPPEEAIKKKAAEALQSAAFKYRHLKVPLRVRNGVLEIPRASFRNKDGSVRMQAYLDLSTMQADTAWQAGVPSDRNAKWPPVKVQLAGPLRELGAKSRLVSAEEFARTLLVHKMEGDITRLENLGKPQAAAPWGAKQEPAPASTRRKPEGPQAQAGAARGATDFENRMRDALSKNPQ